MDIPQYLAEIRNIFETEFASLSEEKLNWKRDTDSWSIGQCLHHIINLDQLYLKEFRRSTERKTKLTDRLLMPIARRYHKLLLPYVRPIDAKPTKTFDIFQPAKSNIPISILAAFPAHLSDIERSARLLTSNDHQLKITHSPVNRMIFVPCQEVPEILSLHAMRHLQQALRVKQDPAF